MKRNILSNNKLLTCYKLAIISVLLFISGTPEQDSIAKRIVDGMPKWSPGGTKDQLIEIEYSISIHFRDIPME